MHTEMSGTLVLVKNFECVREKAREKRNCTSQGIENVCLLLIKMRGAVCCEIMEKCHSDNPPQELLLLYLHVEHLEVSELFSAGVKLCDFVEFVKFDPPPPQNIPAVQ